MAKAMEVVVNTYDIARQLPQKVKYNFNDQILRSALSILW